MLVMRVYEGLETERSDKYFSPIKYWPMTEFSKSLKTQFLKYVCVENFF